MSLEDYSTEDLLEELRRRRAKTCTCGPLRRQIVRRSKGFTDRVGCLTCNTWDDPTVRCIGPTV